MKVLFVTNQFTPPRSTGSGRSSFLIYDQLVKRGHEVDLVVMDSKEYEDDYKRAGLEDEFMPRTLFNQLKVPFGVKDGEYDVIHKYGAGLEKIFFGFRNFEETKTVCSINGIAHGCWNYFNYDKCDDKCCHLPKKLKCVYGDHSPIKRKRFPINFFSLFYFPLEVVRLFVQNFDKYLAVSGAMKKMYEKAGFNKNKIDVVYNSFDPKLKDKVAERDSSSDKLRVLYVGRIDEEKGVEDLIKAFNEVKTSDVRLDVVGSGDLEPELVARYGHCSGINFVGQVPYGSDKMLDLYSKADVFVHPGRWPEPSGRAVCEAGVSRCAIVASDVGGPGEMVRGRGLLFEPGDVKCLADCLQVCFEDDGFRKESSDACFEFFSRFSPEWTGDRIEEVYEELVG